MSSGEFQTNSKKALEEEGKFEIGSTNVNSGREILNKLSKQEFISDLDFDQLYPEHIRKLSEMHWTSVAIAIRVAGLAVKKPGDRILDVGSGVGKFCVIGSSITPGFFYGVEQRESLVGIARGIVSNFNLPRIRFFKKNALDMDWRPYKAIYLFNPFSENFDESIRIDSSCDLSVELYAKYVEGTHKKLAELHSGTRVITLNGFGGECPPTYQMVHKEEINFLPLKVWEKN